MSRLTCVTDKSAGALYTSLTRGTRHVQHRIWRRAAWVIRRARVSLEVRLQVYVHARLACETSRVGGMRARRVRVVVGVPDASDMGDA